MNFIKNLFFGVICFFLCSFLSLLGLLLFAFPKEMKEFKKDIIDMVEDDKIRWVGYLIFLLSMIKIYGLFDFLEGSDSIY